MTKALNSNPPVLLGKLPEGTLIKTIYRSTGKLVLRLAKVGKRIPTGEDADYLEVVKMEGFQSGDIMVMSPMAKVIVDLEKKGENHV